MSFERAKKHLESCGLGEKVRELEVSSATVELAALALGCEAKRIAKSLTFRLGERTLMIVLAGDAKLDNAKYKARFGAKASMLTAEEVASRIGHTVGGVCPFGVEPGVEIYLDASLRRFETVFPACGSSNSCVVLTIPELEGAVGAHEWVDVAKNWQEAPESP